MNENKPLREPVGEAAAVGSAATLQSNPRAPGVQIPKVQIPAEFLQDEPPRRTWVTWAILGFAAIALTTQVLWYQFDSWSKTSLLRPVYAQTCAVLGCELPILRNVGLIEARNSVLRDHPADVATLVYDALLVNRAEFEQPYPLIELTLTTMGGHLVASQRYDPAQYLSGDVMLEDKMVPQTPVHVSIDINNPGDIPLNFKVRFIPFDG